MAHKTRVNGTNYGITGGKCRVNGTNYSIKKGRTLIGRTGYDILFTKKLGNMAVGESVYLNENGSPAEFYVAKHNYENGLNGSGRTLVVRKDCYDTRAWNSAVVNAWASCTLRSWLNGDYLNMLDADIRGVIGTTKYYYTPGNGDKSVTTRSDAVFQLSITELGKTSGDVNAEGTALPIASTLQVAHLNGSSVKQWTRSPSKTDTVTVSYLDWSGNVNSYFCTRTNGSRPAFTLPSSIAVNPSDYTIIG